MINFNNEWDNILADEFKKEYYLNLHQFLALEYKTQTIFPDMYDIFNALKYTSYSDVRVVIIGQDPYHGVNQAHGLAFSVKNGNPFPPSLKNIFKEIKEDIGADCVSSELIPWAKQGVLLLNAVLTVRSGKPQSHKKKGWEIFTNNIIAKINERESPVVFLLWGNDAKAKQVLITNPIHKVLTTTHPSPLSAHAGFLGCRHFSKTNEFLLENGFSAIDWATK